MSFGERLKEIRLTKEVTQQELAEKAVCTQAMIAQIERGTKVPTVILAQDIARALGCSVDELMRN